MERSFLESKTRQDWARLGKTMLSGVLIECGESASVYFRCALGPSLLLLQIGENKWDLGVCCCFLMVL